MQFKAFAFIFLTPGFSPEKNSVITENNSYKFKAVGMDMNEKSNVIAIAKALVDEGFQMIELCGGFGPEWVHKVSEAINYQIPIGGVFYGPQYRKQLVELFQPE